MASSPREEGALADTNLGGRHEGRHRICHLGILPLGRESPLRGCLVDPSPLLIPPPKLLVQPPFLHGDIFLVAQSSFVEFDPRLVNGDPYVPLEV